MMLIGLARLGQDGVVRFLPDGSPVLNLALAFNYGKKDAINKRPTQWVDAAMFGERGQKLSQYMVKGQQLMVHLSDPHMEVYTARDGTQGTKMVAYVQHVEFAGSPPEQAGQAAQAPRQQQRQAAPAPAPAGNRSNDFTADIDDIPFIYSNINMRVDAESSQLGRARHGRVSSTEF